MRNRHRLTREQRNGETRPSAVPYELEVRRGEPPSCDESSLLIAASPAIPKTPTDGDERRRRRMRPGAVLAKVHECLGTGKIAFEPDFAEERQVRGIGVIEIRETLTSPVARGGMRESDVRYLDRRRAWAYRIGSRCTGWPLVVVVTLPSPRRCRRTGHSLRHHRLLPCNLAHLRQ